MDKLDLIIKSVAIADKTIDVLNRQQDELNALRTSLVAYMDFLQKEIESIKTSEEFPTL